MRMPSKYKIKAMLNTCQLLCFCLNFNTLSFLFIFQSIWLTNLIHLSPIREKKINPFIIEDDCEDDSHLQSNLMIAARQL
jgi:hypothetical protein